MGLIDFLMFIESKFWQIKMH